VDIDALRRLCLSLPGTTEQIQWGDALLFKVCGKMFAVANLEPSEVWLSFKVTQENFSELTERTGIIPAPYLARASWIAIQSPTLLPTAELASLLRGSYELVLAKLPRKTRESLTAASPKPRASSRRVRKSLKPTRK
jgi:predicted DNA-binding protein (MmcQ/YjbR family)